MRCKWILVLFSTLLCSSAFAQEEERGQYDQVAQTVEKKILDQKKVQVDNLTVRHEAGTVYLEGVAKLYGSRYKAGEAAAEVKGIEKVENMIAVTAGEVSDSEIEATLMAKIRQHLRPEPFDLLSVKVRSGSVLLSGVVVDTTLKEDALEETIWTKGVRYVENQIQLASIAAGDQRLRRLIYTRLSREFPRYFVGRYPSIIIVVENARVTLVGSVGSLAEKEKISSMIRSLPGVLSVNNLLESS